MILPLLNHLSENVKSATSWLNPGFHAQQSLSKGVPQHLNFL